MIHKYYKIFVHNFMDSIFLWNKAHKFILRKTFQIISTQDHKIYQQIVLLEPCVTFTLAYIFDVLTVAQNEFVFQIRILFLGQYNWIKKNNKNWPTKIQLIPMIYNNHARGFLYLNRFDGTEEVHVTEFFSNIYTILSSEWLLLMQNAGVLRLIILYQWKRS